MLCIQIRKDTPVFLESLAARVQTLTENKGNNQTAVMKEECTIGEAKHQERGRNIKDTEPSDTTYYSARASLKISMISIPT